MQVDGHRRVVVAVVASGLTGSLLALAPRSARADTYPARPLRMIVPFPAGGPHDVTGRIVCEELGRRLGQPVIVENKPGAGGNIGAELAARSAADGYTLFWAQAATHGINPWIYRKIGFDPVRDFAPVALVGQAPILLLTHPRSGIRSMRELIAGAKAAPDAIAFGSGGNGSSPHVAGELLKHMAGIRLRHIPYKGSAAALNDAIAGHVDLVFDGIQSTQGFIQDGRLVPLAVATPQRLAAYPQLPTMAEDVPGYAAASWSAVAAPAATPPAVVALLNKELNAVLRLPQVRERFQQLRVAVLGGSPADMDRFVRDELTKWKKVTSEMAITID